MSWKKNCHKNNYRSGFSDKSELISWQILEIGKFSDIRICHDIFKFRDEPSQKNKFVTKKGSQENNILKLRDKIYEQKQMSRDKKDLSRK